MQQDAARLAYRGRTASIGFAHGQFVRVNAGASGKRAAGSPLEEAEAFRGAVARCSCALNAADKRKLRPHRLAARPAGFLLLAFFAEFFFPAGLALARIGASSATSVSRLRRPI